MHREVHSDVHSRNPHDAIDVASELKTEREASSMAPMSQHDTAEHHIGGAVIIIIS